MDLFKQTVQEIIEKVEGIISAHIVGVDGIVIEQSVHPDNGTEELCFDIVAAEFTSLIKNAFRTSDDIEIGEIQELTVFTGTYHFVIKMITHEYYVMAILQPGGNFGKARYELKKAGLLLEREFQI